MAACAGPSGRDGGDDAAAAERHHSQRLDQSRREGDGWQLVQGLAAEMAEKTAQQNSIAYSAAIRLARRGKEWQRTLGGLEEMTERTLQRKEACCSYDAKAQAYCLEQGRLQ